LRAASTLKNSDGEQRALRKFSGQNLDLSLLKRNVLRQVIWLTLFNQSQHFTANCALLAMMSNYVWHLRVSFSAPGTPGERAQGDPKLSNPTL